MCKQEKMKNKKYRNVQTFASAIMYFSGKLTLFLQGEVEFDPPPVVFFTKIKKYWSEAVEIF